MPPRARLARERARDTVAAEILQVARAQLAEVGPGSLSLRAVAREMGMAPSALFRYLPHKDALLTELIIAGYDALGEAAEAAEAATHDAGLAERWAAICQATRDWALSHPQEYALIFGSPVPGYAAPQDTVGPATRIPGLLTGLLADALAAGLTAPESDPRDAALMHAAIAPVRATIPPSVPDELVVRGLIAWTHLFGAVSFEVFGHRTFDVLDDPAAFFEHEVRVMGYWLGLIPD